jgi:predicted FMN-binding regulatory protein PaiB
VNVLRLTRLEATAKMSQNREACDRAGVIEGLADRGHVHDESRSAGR